MMMHAVPTAMQTKASLIKASRYVVGSIKEEGTNYSTTIVARPLMGCTTSFILKDYRYRESFALLRLINVDREGFVTFWFTCALENRFRLAVHLVNKTTEQRNISPARTF